MQLIWQSQMPVPLFPLQWLCYALSKPSKILSHTQLSKKKHILLPIEVNKLEIHSPWYAYHNNMRCKGMIPSLWRCDEIKSCEHKYVVIMSSWFDKVYVFCFISSHRLCHVPISMDFKEVLKMLLKSPSLMLKNVKSGGVPDCGGLYERIIRIGCDFMFL